MVQSVKTEQKILLRARCVIGADDRMYSRKNYWKNI